VYKFFYFGVKICNVFEKLIIKNTEIKITSTSAIETIVINDDCRIDHPVLFSVAKLVFKKSKKLPQIKSR